MPTHIALLRGINVGGKGILPMKDLAALCSALGFANPRTYIQSGNVLFESPLSRHKLRTALEDALAARMARKVDVLLRTPQELRSILAANPFPGREPSKTAVVFLGNAVSGEIFSRVSPPGGEEIHPCGSEVFVFYPNGMGQTKLKLPLAGVPSTVRNIATVAKLLALAEGSANSA